jgi:hypothetical protein
MFKEYCHMSSLTLVLYILQPLNPINIKKKELQCRPRARAKIHKYRFVSLIYTYVFPFLAPLTLPFLCSSSRIAATQHFNINPLSCSYPRSYRLATLTATSLSHLASIRCSFLAGAQSTRLAPQTTRYAQTIK